MLYLSTQSENSVFVLGGAYREGRVVPNQNELDRLVKVVSKHLSDKMGRWHFHQGLLHPIDG